jgi:1-acyl-sn-glycerol-3-phosphate acyltransferase
LTFLRSLLFQAFFWTWSVLINLAYIPALLMPRRVTIRGMALWARVSFWGLKHIAGMDYEVRGRENIPAGPAIFAAKHLSMWETVATHLLFPDPAIIMKRELLAVPGYGWYARSARMIVIDREGGAKTIRSMISDAKAAIADKRQIVIFPEGTRRPLEAQGDYKPGIAALYGALDVPCVPIAHNSGLYWPRRGFARKPGKVVVEILPPIPPGLKRHAFMAELEGRIEQATRRLLAEGGFQATPTEGATLSS